jgi:prepilin-type N-terminal cleavage/methylation domain-containing protein
MKLSKPGGFSLIEVALVVAILAIIGGGLISSIGARLINKRIAHTERHLRDARTALVGFAAVNDARLPCPDADGDGKADGIAPERAVTNAFCEVADGGLPWRTLGVAAHDAWGNVVRYRPDAAFAHPNGLASPPNTRDGITVLEARTGVALTLGDPHAPAAIVYSCGTNGQADGENVPVNAPSSCRDGVVLDIVYAYGPPGADFDDVVVWVSKNVLIAHLVAAGAWPH